MSVVQQDPFLFSISIRENILYGLDDDFYKNEFGLSGLTFDELKENPRVVHEIDRSFSTN